MTDWKDQLSVTAQEARLRLKQTGFSFGSFVGTMPRGKRIIFYVLLIALLPAVVLVRVGSQLAIEAKLKSSVVTAHPSYDQASNIKVGDVRLIDNGNGSYSAYTEIENPNLELGAST